MPLTYLAPADSELGFDTDAPQCSNIVGDNSSPKKVCFAITGKVSAGGYDKVRIFYKEVDTVSGARTIHGPISSGWETANWPNPIGGGFFNPAIARVTDPLGGTDKWFIAHSSTLTPDDDLTVWNQQQYFVWQASADKTLWNNIIYDIGSMYGLYTDPYGYMTAISKTVYSFTSPEGHLVNINTINFSIRFPSGTWLNRPPVQMDSTNYYLLRSRPQENFWFDAVQNRAVLVCVKRSSTGLADKVVALYWDNFIFNPAFENQNSNADPVEILLDTMPGGSVTGSTPLVASPRIKMGIDGVLRVIWNRRNSSSIKTIGLAFSSTFGATWQVVTPEPPPLRGVDGAAHAIVWFENDWNSLCIDRGARWFIDMLGDQADKGETFLMSTDDATGASLAWHDTFSPVRSAVPLNTAGISQLPGPSAFIDLDRYRIVPHWTGASAQLWLLKEAGASLGPLNSGGGGGHVPKKWES